MHLPTKLLGKEFFLTHFLDNLILHETPRLLKIFEKAM